ncbi:Iridoid synthase [Handroanthus impetiginosus]|uniref:Iridoid synthase n=1 Tax=Handroanthus impetiginosus TaxID=429701 RepID=A0A2G9HFB3_9LAMI|nr:Iridoid synthase [Handroanthus impetiginosus]
MAIEHTKPRFVAAIFGVTGLVGKELARVLLSTRKWTVYGIARRPESMSAIDRAWPDYRFISCDLLNPLETQERLSPLEDLTHIFWITWANQFPLDSFECYEQNRVMMANVLNVILPKAKGLRHVSLQTGTKHYVSLQGCSWEQGVVRYYDEQSPRVSNGNNFYYGLEDLLQERLPYYSVNWSIHRPGLIMGCSRKTLYNFIDSICVYGTICKYLNLPFVFGGTKQCWEEMCVDASDARLVAEQHIWASTSPHRAITGEAFNAINGENYTWKEIWPAIGTKLGVDVPEKGAFLGHFMFASAMADKGTVWKEIVLKEGLVQTKIEDLANWDFLDVLFRCPTKMLGTRKKVDFMGFKTKYQVLDSIFYWIDIMRAEKFIP